MNKAEERAMEVYPPRMAYNSMVSVALKEKIDINSNNRQKFIQGYVTAQQDQKQVNVDLDNFIKEEFDKHSYIDGYGQLSVSYNMAEFYSMIKRLIKAQKGE